MLRNRLTLAHADTVGEITLMKDVGMTRYGRMVKIQRKTN